MEIGRHDYNDRGFLCNLVRSSLVRDADRNVLLIHYYQLDEVLPFMSVFAYVAEFPDRLPAHSFRFGYRLFSIAFRISQGDKTLIDDDGRLGDVLA